MAVVNGYATLTELKIRLGIEDSADDAALETIIEAVSRAIDDNRSNKYFRRRFYTATETRYYTATNGVLCLIDDLIDDGETAIVVATDSDGDGIYTTITASGYVLSPRNAPLDNEPYTYIRVTGSTSFATSTDAVAVTGPFGYSTTVPVKIKEACVKICERAFKRDDLIFGTAGNAEMGTTEAVTPLMKDQDIMFFLQSVPIRDDDQEGQLLASFSDVGYSKPTFFSVATGNRGR